MKRDYFPYQKEIPTIEAFEKYEKIINIDLGEVPDDFMPWFECFRTGFEAGRAVGYDEGYRHVWIHASYPPEEGD